MSILNTVLSTIDKTVTYVGFSVLAISAAVNLVLMVAVMMS